MANLLTKADDHLADLLNEPAPDGISDIVRFDHAAKRWHLWNGIRWAPDQTGQVYNLIRDRLARWWEATEDMDASKAGETRKALMPLYDQAKKESVLRAFSSYPGIGMRGDEWDQNPYLLGCENGIVDLRENALMPVGDPTTLVSKTTGQKFVPLPPFEPGRFIETARSVAPEFMRVMHDWMSKDESMVNFLLLWFGASMFGFSPEQRFLLMVGVGRNGKGALKHSIMKAIGEYGAQPDANLYMRSKWGAPGSKEARADLMDLKGRRITFFSEPAGNKFNEEMLKAHTGGDRITARALYSNEQLEWEPTHSITFLVNNPPEVDDLGPSMADRVMVADFRERYDGEKADKRLYGTLEKEAGGILSILCWTACAWYQSWTTDGIGITMPPRVQEQTKVFMEKGDVLAAFIHEALVADQAVMTQSALLFDAYTDWRLRAEREEPQMSRNKFAAGLLAKGYKKVDRNTGAYWVGLKPKSAVEIAVGEAE